MANEGGARQEMKRQMAKQREQSREINREEITKKVAAQAKRDSASKKR